MKIIVLSFFLPLAIFSCKKEQNEIFWYSYAETGCLDEWRKYPHRTDEELKSAVKQYCSENQIIIYDVKVHFDSTKTEFCYACHCTTGRLIIIGSPDQNDTNLIKLGFWKNI